MPDRRSNTDHDVLIEVRTKLDLLTTKVDDLTTSTVNRVDLLEKQVATNVQVLTELVKNDTDKEARLRFVEKYVWGAIAIIGLLNLIGFAYVIEQLNH